MVDASGYGAIAAKVFGTALSAAGDKRSAKATKKEAEFNARRTEQAAERSARQVEISSDYRARQLTSNAGQAEATGQISAAEEARRSQLLQSRALALAAASGGGSVDPTVLKIISSLASDGDLAARTRVHAGEEQGRDLRNEAAATRYGGASQAAATRYSGASSASATRYTGKVQASSYNTRAVTTVLSGAKGIYDSLNTGDDKGFAGAKFDGSSNQENAWD